MPCTTGKLHGRLKSPVISASPSSATVAPCHGESAAERQTSVDAGETLSSTSDEELTGVQAGVTDLGKRGRRHVRRRLVPVRLRADDSGDDDAGDG